MEWVYVKCAGVYETLILCSLKLFSCKCIRHLLGLFYPLLSQGRLQFYHCRRPYMNQQEQPTLILCVVFHHSWRRALFSTIEISLFLSENRHGPRIPKVCSGSANELQWYEDLSLFSSHLSHGFLDIPQLYGGGPLNKDAGNFLTSKGVPIFVFYGSYVKFLTHLKTVSG